MIEQYLYSRSSNKKQNSLGETIEEGFGGIAKTSGLKSEDVKKLEVFGNDYYPTVEHSNGSKPEVFMKYCLDNKSKDMVWAKTSSISQPQRMAHISHQIVFRDESKRQFISNMEALFSLDFIDRDVDGEDIILKESTEIKTDRNVSINMDLRDVIAQWKLSADAFWKIITAVFDCVAFDRKIIFLTDFSDEKSWDTIRDLLFHIFRFIPTSYREVVGFDSCYSKNSNKSCIHICFADKSLSKKVSKTLYKLDQKNCLYDYVVDDGEIIHTADPEKKEVFAANNIFLKEIQLKIGDEILKHQFNRELDKTFFTIFDTMLSGASNEIMTSIDSYSAVSVVNQIDSGRKVSREHAFLVTDKYLEITGQNYLIKDDIWVSSIQNYFSLYEKDNSDNPVIEKLVKIYANSRNLSNFAFSLLKNKLQADLKNNGIEEIDRYSKCIGKTEYEKNKQLISVLFYEDKQISKWYIHYAFTSCTTAKNVMEKTVWIISENDDPDTDFLISVQKEIITRIQSLDLKPENIQEIYSAIQNNSDVKIQALFAELLEEIMRKVDYKNEAANWFKTLPKPAKFSPRSDGSVLAYLVGDVLSDPSQKALAKYLYPYSNVITRKKAPDMLLSLSDILSNMFLDGRIDFEKDNFHSTMLAVTSLGFIDVTMLSMILCEYPGQIKDFLLWYCEKYTDYPLPAEDKRISIEKNPVENVKKKKKKNSEPEITIKKEKPNTYYMDALLKSITESLQKPLSSVDAKDISLCAELLMEQNLAGDYGYIFIGKIFDYFVKDQKGIVKLFYKLKKRF